MAEKGSEITQGQRCVVFCQIISCCTIHAQFLCSALQILQTFIPDFGEMSIFYCWESVKESSWVQWWVKH